MRLNISCKKCHHYHANITTDHITCENCGRLLRVPQAIYRLVSGIPLGNHHTGPLPPRSLPSHLPTVGLFRHRVHPSFSRLGKESFSTSTPQSTPAKKHVQS